MNETNKFRLGDKVTISGTVTHTFDGAVVVSTLETGELYMTPSDVTLVERPEPTRTFELTRDQLERLTDGPDNWDLETSVLYRDLIEEFDNA